MWWMAATMARGGDAASTAVGEGATWDAAAVLDAQSIAVWRHRVHEEMTREALAAAREREQAAEASQAGGNGAGAVGARSSSGMGKGRGRAGASLECAPVFNTRFRIAAGEELASVDASLGLWRASRGERWRLSFAPPFVDDSTTALGKNVPLPVQRSDDADVYEQPILITDSHDLAAAASEADEQLHAVARRAILKTLPLAFEPDIGPLSDVNHARTALSLLVSEAAQREAAAAAAATASVAAPAGSPRRGGASAPANARGSPLRASWLPGPPSPARLAHPQPWVGLGLGLRSSPLPARPKSPAHAPSLAADQRPPLQVTRAFALVAQRSGR